MSGEETAYAQKPEKLTPGRCKESWQADREDARGVGGKDVALNPHEILKASHTNLSLAWNCKIY